MDAESVFWSIPGITLTETGRRFIERIERLGNGDESLLDKETAQLRTKEALEVAHAQQPFRWKTEFQFYIAIASLLTNGGRSTAYGLGTHEARADNEIGRIYAQRRIGPYTADILVDCDFLRLADPLRLVVECDGPAHEKASQFRLDRRRDRWLSARGYRVLRFASSEVVARGMESALTCAKEVHDTILAHLELEGELLARRACFIGCGLGALMEKRSRRRIDPQLSE